MQNNDAHEVKQPGKLFCWLSGMTPSVRPEDWYGPWGLEIAHIASGQGRARRTNDRRSVLLLCSLAHRLHVSDSDKHPTMHIAGREWPTIDERHTLWLKRETDGEYFSIPYLQSIWIGKVPEPVKPPTEWNTMFFRHTGIWR